MLKWVVPSRDLHADVSPWSADAVRRQKSVSSISLNVNRDVTAGQALFSVTQLSTSQPDLVVYKNNVSLIQQFKPLCLICI